MMQTTTQDPFTTPHVLFSANPDPHERLYTAMAALRALCSLVSASSHAEADNTMANVKAEEFCSLLHLIGAEMQAAYNGLIRGGLQ